MNLANLKKDLGQQKAAKVIKFAVAISIALFILEVWVVNRLSTYGDKIQELKNIQASLKLENQILENTLASKKSLLSIEKRAEQLGFTYAKKLEYLSDINLASGF